MFRRIRFFCDTWRVEGYRREARLRRDEVNSLLKMTDQPLMKDNPDLNKPPLSFWRILKMSFWDALP